jgi:hypothetical protein
MISLKRIEPGLYSYTHTHNDGNVIEYRVGTRGKIDRARYYKKQWIIAIFSGEQRIRLTSLVSDDIFRKIPAFDLVNHFPRLDDAKKMLESYIQLCIEENHPSPFELLEQSKANYRRAMKALVDEIVEKRYDLFAIDKIQIGMDRSIAVSARTNSYGSVYFSAEIHKRVIDVYRKVIEPMDDAIALDGEVS